ncbi:MAG: AraC family transcriptional regulator [Lacisediminihabitans sp.]
MSDTELPGATEPQRATKSMRFGTREIDEALIVGSQVWYPHSLRVLDRTRPFGVQSHAVSKGPVTLGWLKYNGEIHLETGELADSYQVNAPVTGTFMLTYGRQSALGNPQRAVIHGPTRPTTIEGWGEPTRMLGVKIDRHALEAELASMLDRPVSQAINFENALDLDSGPPREWWSLVRQLAGCLADPGPTPNRDLLTDSLVRRILRGLLLAAHHDSSHELDDDGRGVSEYRAVRRAADFMHANAASITSLAEIAAHANVGVRALQLGFQRSLGTTPTTYLRDLRLDRAREDLAASDPELGVVARTAARWGFAHPGRFAMSYARRFSESPSETLHAVSRLPSSSISAGWTQ